MIVLYTYHGEQDHFYAQSPFGIHYMEKPSVALRRVRAVVFLLIAGFLGVEGYRQSHQNGSLVASVMGFASLSGMDIACRCPCHSCVP